MKMLKCFASIVTFSLVLITPNQSQAFVEVLFNTFLGTAWKVGVPMIMSNLTAPKTTQEKKQRDAMNEAIDNIRRTMEERANAKGVNLKMNEAFKVEPLQDTYLIHFNGTYEGNKAVFVFAAGKGKGRNQLLRWVDNGNHPIINYKALTTSEVASKFNILTPADMEVAKNMTTNNSVIAATTQ